MVGGIHILMAVLLVAGGVGAGDLDGAGGWVAGEDEDERPLYYGSEVVVTSDRPTRFEPFAPEHAVVEGSAGDEIAWAPHVQLGDYGTSAYVAARGLPREHVGYEYDRVPMNSLQNGLFKLTLFDVFDTHATLMRGPFARLATGRSALAAVSMRPSYSAGSSVALVSGSRQDAARFSHHGDAVGFRPALSVSTD